MRCYGALVLGLAGLLFFHCEAATAGACPDPREDFGAIKKRFDPKNEWGESAANIHIIGALYQYKMSKGDIDGAACSAFQMIQYHRQAQQRYAVIVECAAHIGDLDTRCRAAMTTYQKLLPDAKDIKFQPTHGGHLSYTYVDGKTGKTMLQAVDTVDKLASTAMGFAENGFDKALLTTAEPEITRRSVQGVAPAKPKEMLRVPMVPLRDMDADVFLDAPTTLSRHPMNCVTMKLDKDMSTTNCNKNL